MRNRALSLAGILLAAAGAVFLAFCSSSTPPSSKETKPEVTAAQARRRPMSETNPDVVEETDAYYVTRYKKSEMIKVDDHHVRLPLMPRGVLLYREDADYYYVRTEKIAPEEASAQRQATAAQKQTKRKEENSELEASARENPLIVSPSQFDTLAPPIASSGARFRRAGAGLPTTGQWRQNIAIADMDGDGILDIVAPPPRLGDSTPHIFYGDGKGDFHERPIRLVDSAGKALPRQKLDYGGVAVADFDGDGKPDIALASHGLTVRILRNRGDGSFELGRNAPGGSAGKGSPDKTASGKRLSDDNGLPPRYSSQAVAAFDVNGDGRPDLVVSRDIVDTQLRHEAGKDAFQVRVFVNEGRGRWRNDPEAIQGACFSFNLFPIDLSGSGPARDLLTGCRFLGGWGLTWKNDGKGRFSNELFENIEQAAYHFAVAPGTVGSDHHTAFADLYAKELRGWGAGGLNVYFKDSSGWHKIAIWRQKNFRGRLTSVAMGDLNGDGLADVVFPDRADGKVRIFYQMANGSFRESPADREPALDSPAVDVRLADLNGDGRLDIVMARTTFSEARKDPGGFEVLLNEGR